jgi:hypothetical protein
MILITDYRGYHVTMIQLVKVNIIPQWSKCKSVDMIRGKYLQVIHPFLVGACQKNSLLSSKKLGV